MACAAVASLLVYPVHRAFGPGFWNADLIANTTSGKRSKSISLSWDTDYPVGCIPQRLMLRYEKDNDNTATAPDATDPTDGHFLLYLDTDDGSHPPVPLHSRTSYAYSVYACTSMSGCSTHCLSTNASDEVQTQKERWVVTGVHSYDTETGKRIVDVSEWSEASTPESHRFRAGDHEDEVGVFFKAGHTADPIEDGAPDGIYQIRTGPTWQDDWNDTGLWSYPEALVQVTDNDGDYHSIMNIMVVPTRYGATNHLLRLFWTTDHGDGSPENNDYEMFSMISTDDDGDDFGVCCSDTGDCSSTTGCVLLPFDEVCCDFEDVTVQSEFHGEDGNCLNNGGWHGHDLWDDVGATWDPDEDELAILFSGSTEQGITGCENCEDEAGVQMWWWDTGGGCDTGDTDMSAKFCLEEEEENSIPSDTATSWCPKESWWDTGHDSIHDPAALAYPSEVKVYAKKDHEYWFVGYSSDNGRTIEDTSAIEFYFEDEDTGDSAVDTDDVLDPGCIEDMTVSAWVEPSFLREVIVFVPYGNQTDGGTRCFCTQDEEIEINGEGFETYPGLLSAVLHNG